MTSIRGAAAAALAVLCAVAPTALAHEGNPNYRSEVRTIAPALPGLDAEVLNHDDRIQVVYDGDRPLVVENGRYDWHDHRIHWMGEGTLPPQIEDEGEQTKVFDWDIPMASAGRPVAVQGTLTWLGEDEGGFPLGAALSLGAALIGGALLVVVVRRRRARAGAAPAKEAW